MPVALNLYRIRVAKDAGGDLFRSVQKQAPNYQGLWTVSPQGKVLSSHQDMKNMADRKRWTKSVRADIEKGLKAFGPVEPRRVKAGNPLPHRGTGARPDGGVTLAAQVKFVIVRSLDRDPPANALGPTTLDSVPLTAADWAAFAPDAVKDGRGWTIPEATARKLFPLLSPGDRAFRSAKEVTGVRITGRVHKVENGTAYLTYEGHIAATHHGTKDDGKLGNKCSAEAKLIGGAGTYDVKTGTMRSLTLVFDGLWRNYAPYDDPPTRFGAVVEWRR